MMTMKLDIALDAYIVSVNDLLGGKQVVFKFDNGYGASLVNHSGSYGNELAVVKFDSGGDFDLVYDTPVTDDVLPHLDMQGISKALRQIKDL